MRITNVSISRKFKTRKEVLEVVKRVEDELGESLEDYVTEITFMLTNKPYQACYITETRCIEVYANKAINERTSLAHELIHAIQDKQGRIPQIQTGLLLVEYIYQDHEREAWILSTKLFGSKAEKAYVKELYSLSEL